jgi:hypothetical protein
MADTAELLSTVETAIDSLVTGKVQSYQVEGRSFTYVDLRELRLMRTQLRRELATQAQRKKGSMMGRVRWGDS